MQTTTSEKRVIQCDFFPQTRSTCLRYMVKVTNKHGEWTHSFVDYGAALSKMGSALEAGAEFCSIERTDAPLAPIRSNVKPFPGCQTAHDNAA